MDSMNLVTELTLGVTLRVRVGSRKRVSTAI